MVGYKESSDSARLTVDLNRTRYRELVAARGWTRQIEQADGLGIAQNTISRVVEGGQKPGPRFIAACLTAFPGEGFDGLFHIVEDAPLTRAA